MFELANLDTDVLKPLCPHCGRLQADRIDARLERFDLCFVALYPGNEILRDACDHHYLSGLESSQC